MENPQMKANSQNVALGVVAVLLVFAIAGGLFYLMKPKLAVESEYVKFDRERAELGKVYDEIAQAEARDQDQKWAETREERYSSYLAEQKKANAEADARLKAMNEAMSDKSAP